MTLCSRRLGDTLQYVRRTRRAVGRVRIARTTSGWWRLGVWGRNGNCRPSWREQTSGFIVGRPRAHTRRPLQRPSPIFVTRPQAAFRTSTGSSRSASRYSRRNGESIGPSPGLTREGRIAERRAGIQSRSLRATCPRQFPLHPYRAGSKYLGGTEKETEWPRFHAPEPPGNSHCAPTEGACSASAFRRRRGGLVLGACHRVERAG